MEPIPASQQLHLKGPTVKHNGPTLCGRDDPGLYAYARITSVEQVNELRSRSTSEPYPLCEECARAFEAEEQA